VEGEIMHAGGAWPLPNWTLPPSTTPGSVILTVPPMPELM
jgi:hypothetical protein